jgi:hypothetical protein
MAGAKQGLLERVTGADGMIELARLGGSLALASGKWAVLPGCPKSDDRRHPVAGPRRTAG